MRERGEGFRLVDLGGNPSVHHAHVLIMDKSEFRRNTSVAEIIVQ